MATNWKQVTIAAALAFCSTSLGEEAGISVGAVVERLLAGDETPPALHQPDPAAPHDTERTFAFEWIARVEAKTLLEGLKYLSVAYPPPEGETDQAAWQRAMKARYAAVLEYYPLAARDLQDFYLLLGIVEDGSNSPLLREFLIRQCAPGLEARSALGEYLQGMLAGDPEFDEKLARIVENPTESAAVQVAAIDALGHTQSAYYAGVLAGDAMARAYREQGNPAPTIQQVKDTPGSIPLTRRTQVLFERRGEAVFRIGKMLAAVGRDPNRPEAVRKKAHALAATMAREYPSSKSEALQAEVDRPAHSS